MTACIGGTDGSLLAVISLALQEVFPCVTVNIMGATYIESPLRKSMHIMPYKVAFMEFRKALSAHLLPM